MTPAIFPPSQLFWRERGGGGGRGGRTKRKIKRKKTSEANQVGQSHFCPHSAAAARMLPGAGRRQGCRGSAANKGPLQPLPASMTSGRRATPSLLNPPPACLHPACLHPACASPKARASTKGSRPPAGALPGLGRGQWRDRGPTLLLGWCFARGAVKPGELQATVQVPTRVISQRIRGTVSTPRLVTGTSTRELCPFGRQRGNCRGAGGAAPAGAVRAALR